LKEKSDAEELGWHDIGTAGSAGKSNVKKSRSGTLASAADPHVSSWRGAKKKKRGMKRGEGKSTFRNPKRSLKSIRARNCRTAEKSH